MRTGAECVSLAVARRSRVCVRSPQVVCGVIRGSPGWAEGPWADSGPLQGTDTDRGCRRRRRRRSRKRREVYSNVLRKLHCTCCTGASSLNTGRAHGTHTHTHAHTQTHPGHKPET